MEIIGYIMALAIGISLGLIGGGGSILAVPVLAYLFSLDEKVATAYSLFIVGTTALVGSFRQHRSGKVDWRTAGVFGFPAIVGVWLTRHFIVPALPDVLFFAGSLEFTRRMAMFGVFAVLMVCAAWSMLSNKEHKSGTGNVGYNYPLILLEGLVIGVVTGFVGAGGGFLIIPALVILANLEIRTAIGTSLMIIALKSLLGFFLGDAMTIAIDWLFLAQFTGLSIIGIFVGVYFGQFIDGERLRKGFGYFIVAMAVFVFTTEFINQMQS